MATLFKEVLIDNEEYKYFKRIEFAIPNKGKTGSKNYVIFKEVLGGLQQ